MFIGTTKVYLYCEGESEKNYFEAFKGNETIKKKYTLDPIQDKKLNDLQNAINHSKKNPKILNSQKKGDIKVLVLFFYDSDKFENGQSTITYDISLHKQRIYFSHFEFEDFLSCHKSKNHYKNGKKPILHRDLIKEIKNLKLAELKKFTTKPKKYQDFKTIYEFLI